MHTHVGGQEKEKHQTTDNSLRFSSAKQKRFIRPSHRTTSVLVVVLLLPHMVIHEIIAKIAHH